jgi:hypothetical protein
MAKLLGLRSLLFVFVLSVLLLVEQGTVTGIDGESSYRMTQSLVEDGDLALPADVPHTALGRDGDYYSKFGLGLPLLGTVPYALAKPFNGMGGGGEVPRAAVATLMPLLTALLCVVLYQLGRALGGPPRDALLVAVAAMFGTFLLVYSKDFFSEPLLALAIALALWQTVAGRPWLAAAFLAFGMLTRPQALLLAPLFWIFWVHRDGLRGALVPGVILAAGAASIPLYNWLRFEDFTESGYPDDQGFRAEVWTGAWGLLTDPSKSLFLFVPLAALLPFGIWSLRRRGDTPIAWLVTGIVAVGFLTAASWSIWWGGWTWGPRLLIPAIVPVLPVLAPWIGDRVPRRRLVVALAVAGGLVSLAAVVVPTSAQLGETAETDGPHIVRQAELLPGTLANLPDEAPPERPVLPADRWDPYLWQVELGRDAGSSGVVTAAVLSLLLVLVAVLAGRRLWHLSTRPDEAFSPSVAAGEAGTTPPSGTRGGAGAPAAAPPSGSG